MNNSMHRYQKKYNKLFDFISLRYLYHHPEKHEIRPGGDGVTHFRTNDETTRTEWMEAKLTADPSKGAAGISPEVGIHVQRDNKVTYERESNSWRRGLSFESYYSSPHGERGDHGWGEYVPRELHHHNFQVVPPNHKLNADGCKCSILALPEVNKESPCRLRLSYGPLPNKHDTKHQKGLKTYNRCAHWFWQTEVSAHLWAPEIYESYTTPITVTRIISTKLLDEKPLKKTIEQGWEDAQRSLHFDFVVCTRLRELGRQKWTDRFPIHRTSTPKPAEVRAKKDMGYPLKRDRMAFCVWACPAKINWPKRKTMNKLKVAEEEISRQQRCINEIPSSAVYFISNFIRKMGKKAKSKIDEDKLEEERAQVERKNLDKARNNRKNMEKKLKGLEARERRARIEGTFPNSTSSSSSSSSSGTDSERKKSKKKERRRHQRSPCRHCKKHHRDDSESEKRNRKKRDSICEHCKKHHADGSEKEMPRGRMEHRSEDRRHSGSYQYSPCQHCKEYHPHDMVADERHNENRDSICRHCRECHADGLRGRTDHRSTNQRQSNFNDCRENHESRRYECRCQCGNSTCWSSLDYYYSESDDSLHSGPSNQHQERNHDSDVKPQDDARDKSPRPCHCPCACHPRDKIFDEHAAASEDETNRDDKNELEKKKKEDKLRRRRRRRIRRELDLEMAQKELTLLEKIEQNSKRKYCEYLREREAELERERRVKALEKDTRLKKDARRSSPSTTVRFNMASDAEENSGDHSDADSEISILSIGDKPRVYQFGRGMTPLENWGEIDEEWMDPASQQERTHDVRRNLHMLHEHQDRGTREIIYGNRGRSPIAFPRRPHQTRRHHSVHAHTRTRPGHEHHTTPRAASLGRHQERSRHDHHHEDRSRGFGALLNPLLGL
ncbi:hypothetical protein ONS96_004011 [Cadophora gregata f. sp. sojae]|nr:hypothetical protein ONS96_004011 [Cadophora gregata f. sp. sojae]